MSRPMDLSFGCGHLIAVVPARQQGRLSDRIVKRTVLCNRAAGHDGAHRHYLRTGGFDYQEETQTDAPAV